MPRGEKKHKVKFQKITHQGQNVQDEEK